jgi:3-phenylpropionate/trans-cinnamate dioxygenase ferredoxin subunit
MTRVRLCAAADLEVGDVRRFEVEGTELALARCDDGYHAVVDVCSHEEYPLSEGEVFPDLCEIECLRHGSTFSLVDGEPQSLPATEPVRVLAVSLEGEDVLVELP